MRALILILGALAGTPACHAQVYQTQVGTAVFTSRTPSESFDGTSRHLVGYLDLADSTVDFHLDLNTIRTGIALRDRQMRESFLETDRFPFAGFKGKIHTPVDLTRHEPQSVFVMGTFDLHGVERHFELAGKLTPRPDGSLRVEAGWPLNLSDYRIGIPGVLFYRINEQLAIRIDAILIPQRP